MLSCVDHTKTDQRFELKKNNGFKFENTLVNEAGLDVFRYRNYYNGGGVAIGDINNDGLSDIYMVSNQQSNRLFLNKGDFQFEDITNQSGAGGTKPWSTGVAMADVNGDGFLDIYVCNSGDLKGGERGNELFINQGDGSFQEMAKEFGLSDEGFSTHAAFFDFDQDGDLDCYLLNNSFRPVSSLPIENIRDERDAQGGDKFYLNENGHFVDKSAEVGVYGSVIGFGLGITLLDVNNDSYTDIYVSNDFFERDYLYVNQQGQSFTEELENYFDQISMFSMGADAADLNNDGFEEVFVTDMLPDNYERLKQTTRFETYDLFQLKKSRGFYHQFMKNTLQMNTGENGFIEVSRQLGVSATDWSWGALIFDMDNDGKKDIYVANGVYKDVTDQDFLKYFSSEENMASAKKGNEISFETFNERMPSNPLSNYAFTFEEENGYTNQSESWGLSTPSFSNGAAYGDLDNDGDLDLVVNNVNQPAFLYQNNTQQIDSLNYLKLELRGEGKNLFGVGAKVLAYIGEQVIMYQHYPTRGFQSSMDYNITFGLGQVENIDSLKVIWNSQKVTVKKNLSANQKITFDIADAQIRKRDNQSDQNQIFKSQPSFYTHEENLFVDFDYSRLIYHQLSKEGPCVAVADVNADGLDDVFIGGASDHLNQIFINNGKDQFEIFKTNVFDSNIRSEDVAAAFFDANNDGLQDLIVAAGGNDLRPDFRNYAVRLYLNIGSVTIPEWEKVSFPAISLAASCIKVSDYDQDGDLDIYIGGRSIPGKYGIPASSYLLENIGEGQFEDVTTKKINALADLGMITDAEWSDYDGDGDQDLVLVGEWLAPIIFENRRNVFQRKFNVSAFDGLKGWWQEIAACDLDGDGDDDYLLGNWGTNSMFKAGTTNPIRLYISDFDENDALDHVFTFSENGKVYPYHLRDDMVTHMVSLKKKFPDYKSYNNQSIDQIFSPEQLQNSFHLEAAQLKSGVLWNLGEDEFDFQPFPEAVQVAPITEFLIEDFDHDQKKEILLLGNFFATKPEEGVYDANHGVVVKWENQQFQVLSAGQNGLDVRGAVKSLSKLSGKNQQLIFIGINDESAQVYGY